MRTITRLAAVAGLTAALLAPMAAPASAAPWPTGCSLQPTDGHMSAGVALRPASSSIVPSVVVYAPWLNCLPEGAFAVRTTYYLQRYYVTAKLWKTESTQSYGQNHGYQMDAIWRCVTRGALMRVVVNWHVWNYAKHAYVGQATAIGPYRALCT